MISTIATSSHWQADVSVRSPTVRGTWITVDDVISCVLDGWSWADILRDYPELTEDDIRACLSYQVEGEVAAGNDLRR